MYRAVLGDNPPDVVTRLKQDGVLETLITARERFSIGFLHGINRGMEVDEKKRPQSVPEWRAMFTGAAYLAPVKPGAPGAADGAGAGREVEDTPTQRLGPLLERAKRKRPSMAQMTSFAAGALALFLVIGGEQLFRKSGSQDTDQSSNQSQPAAGKDKPPKLTAREFYVLDRDRSGYLTRDEVKGDAVLEQNYDKIDANHDGRISLEEFTNFP
jgi:hypothetical protein